MSCHFLGECCWKRGAREIFMDVVGMNGGLWGLGEVDGWVSVHPFVWLGVS